MAEKQLPPDLFNASDKGDTAKMRDAIDKGADLEWKNKDYYYYTPLIVASTWGRTESVRLLLNEGADVNNTDRDGQTALYLACWNSHEEVIRILLGNGADVENTNVNQFTPLILTAGHNHSSSIVRLLLEAGAEIDRVGVGGKTALEWARQQERCEVVQILEEWSKK